MFSKKLVYNHKLNSNTDLLTVNFLSLIFCICCYKWSSKHQYVMIVLETSSTGTVANVMRQAFFIIRRCVVYTAAKHMTLCLQEVGLLLHFVVACCQFIHTAP